VVESASARPPVVRARFWLFFLLAFAVIALRNPDWWVHPQFVAEDGVVFFREQLLDGWRALFRPYNGYLHTIPRLFAECVSPLPVLWQPFLYQVLSVSLTALCSAYFTLPECRFVIASDWMRMAVSILAIAICDGTYLFGNIAACQVFLLPVGMLLLLGKQESRLRAVAIGLIALTAPALVLFLPVGVVRWVRKSSMTAAVFLICAAIQIGVTLTDSTPVPHQPFPFWLPVAATLESWVYRVPLLMFPGNEWSTVLGVRWGWRLIAPVLLTVVFFAVWARGRLIQERSARQVFSVCLLLGPLLVLTAFLLRRELLDYVHNLDSFVLVGVPRYFFTPTYLLLITIALPVESVGKRGSAGKRGILLLLLFVPALYENYRVTPYQDMHWTAEAAQIERWKRDRSGPVSAPINPGSWKIELP